jgi:hypothetical protein
MAKSLEDLGLKEEKLPTAGQELADLPEFGGFEPPPQPGPFRFELPKDLATAAIWDVYAVPTLPKNADGSDAQRVRVTFDREHPLLIVQSLGGKYNQQPFHTRMSNQERARGRDKSVVASDWDYLLRALEVKQKPASNREYITALKPHGGKQFGADLRYSWRCSQERDIRVRDNAGNVTTVEGTKGCGESFYQEDVPKQADGQVPNEITCTCGALLRAFANLDNIRK